MDNLSPLNPSTQPLNSPSIEEEKKEISRTDQNISKTSQEILQEVDLKSDASITDYNFTNTAESNLSQKVDNLALTTLNESDEDEFGSEDFDIAPKTESDLEIPSRDAALDAKIQAMSNEGITVNLTNVTNTDAIQRLSQQELKNFAKSVLFKLTADADNPFSMVESDSGEAYDFMVNENTVIVNESSAEAVLEAVRTHGEEIGLDMSRPLNLVVVSDDIWEEFKEQLAEFRQSHKEVTKEPVKQQRARESENRNRDVKEAVQKFEKEKAKAAVAEEEPTVVLEAKLHEKAVVEDYHRQEAVKEKDEAYIAKMRLIQEQQISKANLKYQEKIPINERDIKKRLPGGGK